MFCLYHHYSKINKRICARQASSSMQKVQQAKEKYLQSNAVSSVEKLNIVSLINCIFEILFMLCDKGRKTLQKKCVIFNVDTVDAQFIKNLF